MDKHTPFCNGDKIRYHLKDSDVHIWKTDLNPSSEWIDRLTQILAEDERQRADKFKFEKHRKRYIVRRGVLRTILSRYLHIAPEKIAFVYEKNGKPAIKSEDLGDRIFFSVSHSKDVALYAFSKSKWIGIDIEFIRSMNEVENLAKRYFSPEENNILTTKSGDEKLKAFYRLWNIKEAYLKATGEGIAGLERVEMVRTSENTLDIRRIDNSKKYAGDGDWFVKELTPKAGYSAALVLNGGNWNVKMFCNRDYPITS